MTEEKRKITNVRLRVQETQAEQQRQLQTQNASGSSGTESINLVPQNDQSSASNSTVSSPNSTPDSEQNAQEVMVVRLHFFIYQIITQMMNVLNVLLNHFNRTPKLSNHKCGFQVQSSYICLTNLQKASQKVLLRVLHVQIRERFQRLS